MGDPVVDHLQRTGGAFERFVFTPASKQQLMEGLAVAIQKQRIGLVGGPLISELESFEYEYAARGMRYAAPEGCHDDAVCALALAVQHLGLTAAPFVFQVITRRSEFGGNDDEWHGIFHRPLASWETRPLGN